MDNNLIIRFFINAYQFYFILCYTFIIKFNNFLFFKSDDTEYIYMNIGYGFHAQLKLKEAQEYIEKKNKLLEK